MNDKNTLKRLVKKGSLIFLVGMLFLTILSKTIYVLLLPEVTIESVQKGQIETEIYTSGKIGYDKLLINQMKISMRAVNEGQIVNCYVKENERVKKGQVLLDMIGEVNSRQKLQDEMQSSEIAINKQSYEREKQEYERVHAELEEKLSQKRQTLDNGITSYEIIELDKQITSKEQEIEINKELYKVGGISKSECEQTEETLGLLKKKRESILVEEKRKIQDEIEALENKMEEAHSQSLAQDEKIQLEDNKLKSLMTTDEQLAVTSPVDGIVYSINIATGATAMQGDILMVIVPEKVPITLSFTLNERDIENVEIDQELNWIYKQENYVAQVIKKTYQEKEDTNIITCELEQELVKEWIPDYKTYKNVEVEIRESSETYEALVSTSAIHYEGNQPFIYYIEEEENLFEKKYRVYRTPVTVIEEGNYNCAVAGLRPGTKVVATSTKELEDGIEVKLV